MDKKYQVEIVDGIIIVRFRRSPDVLELVGALDEVARIGSGRLRLWDFSCGADLAHKDIEEIEIHANSISLPCGKVGIVAPQDLTYGVFRSLAVYREERQAELNIFRTEMAAIDWLKNDTSDSGYSTANITGC